MGEVFVEIVAKQKGCILCDLAIGINGNIAFDHIPDMEALSRKIREVMADSSATDLNSG